MPTTAHAIGGTAELALRYSIISASSAGPSRFKERLRAGRGCGSMGQHRRFRRGRRTYWLGRAADDAADAAGAAVPTRNYWPDGAADGLSQSTSRRADNTTTRPSGEWADASVRCTGLGVSNTSDEAWAGYLLLFSAKILFKWG
jgi:hypothetical protein